jgi:hypothetical protein
MIIAHSFFRGDSEEHQSNSVEVWNAVSALFSQAVEFCRQRLSAVCGWFGWLGRRPVPLCTYLDGDPTVTSDEIIYRSFIESTMNPYEFTFHDPTHVITGIACVPKDDKTPSPEAEVVDGGVRFSHVVMRLSPVQKGTWACRIVINGV